MKTDPKVSIVIPVYNGAAYIKESLESALNQTYQNLEIIVVNDGSKDKGKTKKIVEKYVKKNPDKIRYFEKENGGVSTALNLALKEMTGDYFSWLSHDDRYYPNKIESQVNYLKKFDENTILYSDYDLMDENSNIFAVANKNHTELMKKKEYALLRGAINGITLLIPMKAFEVCGNFRVDLRCTQDYVLWLKMMTSGFVFVHQPEVLATTRLHGKQVTNTNPKVVTEGNVLWNDITEAFPTEKKIELDGSEYEYYLNMRKFMLTTPYEGTVKYIEGKIEAIEKEAAEKSKNVLVSVVIPFYNRKEVLENAINSVLNQTHKNIELILVNDGSDTVDFLKKYENADNIKLINLEKNQGVSNARNVGILNSSGEYIAMLDSDDLFLENKIEKQLKYMISAKADFSYTSYIRNNGVSEFPINCDMTDNMLEKCIYSCVIATPTIMFKKEFLEKSGLRYDSSLHLGEDCCLYLDVLKHTDIKYIDEYLTVVNVNENSASQNTEKLSLGLKNILRHVLNDECFFKQTYAVAHLCCGLVTTALSNEVRVIPADDPNYRPEKVGFFKKARRVLKEKGFVYCVKRAFRGPARRIKRYWNALTHKGVWYCIKRVCHKVKYNFIVLGRKFKRKK
ncbi:MAG: glycosyltransferase [Clostridia bacterium]|nr:glycosyltransferase [Clostridia bacterium]